MLLVGDDWAEDHHDVEIQDETGRRLGKARLPEGIAGITQLHGLIGRFLPEDAAPEQVVVGIETDRGGWVTALVAAGYQVFAVNPLQVARYRQRHVTSGAKSDAGDAHTLADMVRTDRHQLRPIAPDSALAEAVKVLARAHQTLVWDRSRQVLRLRAALLEFFPAALQAFDDLAAPDALELLAAAPDPASAARLPAGTIIAALKCARRQRVADKAARLQAVLGAEHLAQPSVVVAAYAVTVRAAVAVIGTLNAQIETLEAQVGAHLAGTRTLRSTRASRGSGRSSPPGCWASSVTPPTAMPPCGRARTTPLPARSPASPASGSSCWHVMRATTGSPTRSTSRRSARCEHRRGREPITTRCAPAVSAIMRRCASSPTA